MMQKVFFSLQLALACIANQETVTERGVKTLFSAYIVTKSVGLLKRWVDYFRKGKHMKIWMIAIAVALAATAAQAATAFFTGRQEMVTTVTYQQAWNCQYNYAGQIFWRVYQNSCPSSVEVQ